MRVLEGADLESVRRRGRRLSLKSVQRYTKSHVLIERRATLNRDVIQRGTELRTAWLREFGKVALARRGEAPYDAVSRASGMS